MLVFKKKTNTIQKFSIFQFLVIMLLALTSHASGSIDNKEVFNEEGYYKISVKEYQDKVYGAWIGQIVGNIYGLPHENAYIDEPGPDNFPIGYLDLSRMEEVNGAFSDDDTDLEYMYLLLMEKYGPVPTLEQIAEEWKYQIRDRVWLANRAALGLMHFGFTPPVTGMKKYNPHWFQIDPQLINEIWAVTAPGMVNYAAGISDWAARITADEWGVEPTIHYGAMFAAAFFESDIHKLIDIGSSALPPDSKFRQTVEDMKALYEKYPDDWKQARYEMARKYYYNEPIETRTIWNANLNGACGILALLYGQGDFQLTLDMAVVMGFDADNQTATMCGILGAINGIDVIPEELLFPLEGWEKPFNDRYINVTRHDLPDVGIIDMAKRTAAIGEKIILQNGGKKIIENGVEYLIINKNAKFIPPLEFPKGPEPIIEIGKEINFELFVSGGDGNVEWNILNGTLPEGLEFKNGIIKGVTFNPGIWPVEIQIKQGDQKISRVFDLRVRDQNLAPLANKVLANVRHTNAARRDSLWLTVGYSLYTNDVESIRNGITHEEGSTFYSIDNTVGPKVDYYGYEWNNRKEISLIAFHIGAMEEMGGWFTSLNVEYKNNNGNWTRIDDIQITPPLISGTVPYNKPHFTEYLISFDPVETKAIRIIGDAGGASHWRDRSVHFTSITELSVYKR
jgi:hypothetical protein